MRLGLCMCNVRSIYSCHFSLLATVLLQLCHLPACRRSAYGAVRRRRPTAVRGGGGAPPAGRLQHWRRGAVPGAAAGPRLGAGRRVPGAGHGGCPPGVLQHTGHHGAALLLALVLRVLHVAPCIGGLHQSVNARVACRPSGLGGAGFRVSGCAAGREVGADGRHRAAGGAGERSLTGKVTVPRFNRICRQHLA